MFKAARWRSEKNKIKVEFKLQLHATQVPQVGWESLMVTLVPAEVGKPTVKSEKAVIQDGMCRWESPIYETVRFNREPKTGKISEKIYQLLVSTDNSKTGLVGEASIDLADYFEETKPSSVSLPLKTSNSGTLLHVSIQRIQATSGRYIEENGDAPVRSNNRSLKSQFGNADLEGSFRFSNGTGDFIPADDTSPRQVRFGSNCNKDTSQNLESNGFHKPSTGNESGSASGLDGSSGNDSLQELGLKNNGIHRDDASFLSCHRSNVTVYQKPTTHLRSLTDIQEHRRSNTDLSLSSAQDSSIDESTNSDETTSRERLQSSDSSIEKLRNDIVVLSRQAEVSELELQTLRKQIVKESRRAAEMSKEIGSLKEERDATKRECERLKALQCEIDNGKVTNKSLFDGQNQKHLLEEIRQELTYEKDLNANLRLQLQKTQESNSELILAVQDLEEILERKNKESPCVSDQKTSAEAQNKGGLFLHHGENGIERVEVGSKYEESDDEEQQALDELVRQHSEADMAYSLEQKIIDLSCEIEMHKKEREELEMQMEQLALDYEILKQENHDISSKLEQSRLQEQLKMQYEYSASLAAVGDLEDQVESLEKELQKQAEAFEADLTEITQVKVEQEQRAIRAEEALRKMRWNNANTAERLQEEFRRLSIQMASTFDANEKLAMQALSEANELRLEKKYLEDLLENANEEIALLKDQYQREMEELSREIEVKKKEIGELRFKNDEKSKELENQKQYLDSREKDFSNEIVLLETKIEEMNGEKNDLFEEVKKSRNLRVDVQLKEKSIKEMEMLLKRGDKEREVLQKKVEEAEKLLKELNDARLLKDEKETVVESLESEVAILRAQYNDLKYTLFEDELEKENLRKQVFHLKGDLRKKEDAITAIERKFKDSNTRILNPDGTIRSMPRSNKMNRSPPATKEVSNLREKIKLLEGEIKQKEAAFESSTISFLKKEKDLCNKIEELEKCIEENSQNNSLCFSKGEVLEMQKARGIENEDASANPKVRGNKDENLGEEASPNQSGMDILSSSSTTNINMGKELEASTANSDQDDNADLLNQIALLRERNESMEKELKEMQERYSGISLKFAEVEGERQQLVMTIRNLKNAKKS